jgi:ssDNA-binding Zn-finger/Zn-ribbon topoisomerase 1
MRIKATRFDSYFIACEGFPVCKNTMNFPKKGILDIKLLENNICKEC